MGEFEEIAQTAIREAQGVECPFKEYVTGLREIVELLNETLEAAETEQKEGSL